MSRVTKKKSSIFPGIPSMCCCIIAKVLTTAQINVIFPPTPENRSVTKTTTTRRLVQNQSYRSTNGVEELPPGMMITNSTPVKVQRTDSRSSQGSVHHNGPKLNDSFTAGIFPCILCLNYYQELLSKITPFILLTTFKFIKAVCGTVFDMINAVYRGKPLMFIRKYV